MQANKRALRRDDGMKYFFFMVVHILLAWPAGFWWVKGLWVLGLMCLKG